MSSILDTVLTESLVYTTILTFKEEDNRGKKKLVLFHSEHEENFLPRLEKTSHTLHLHSKPTDLDYENQ